MHTAPHGKKATSLERFTRVVDRSRERVTSRLASARASAIVDVEAFRRVWGRIKPIIRNKIDKYSEHNPKIGPLTDLHAR